MKKRISCLILCFVILACLFGCADKGNNDTPDAEPTAGAVQLDADSMDESVLVYIGASSRGFEAYPVDCGDEVTPDALIRQISELTGWNLDLTKPAVMDDSGVSVGFASTSCIFTGPPENQKDEFYVYDAYDMCETALDSVAETLRRNFSEEGEVFSVWYYTERDAPLELPEFGMSWVDDESYKWTNGFCTEQHCSGQTPAA